MDITSLIDEVRKQKLAGRRYEMEGHRQFRDCVTICRDKRLKYERFYYGEAAGRTCLLWAEAVDANGKIPWDFSKSNYSKKEEAPKRITKVEDGLLFFDDKEIAWLPTSDLKTDKDAKLSAGKMFFLHLFGK